MINPKVEKGDRIICLHMSDDFGGIPPLTQGTVKRVGPDPFEKDGLIIYVKWDNGSELSLLSITDKWALATDVQKLQKNKKIQEAFEKEKNLMKGAGLAKFYKMVFLFKFLNQLRMSGIVNMFGASDYLWMGKDRIDSLHRYDSTSEDNEDYETLLEMSDEAQSIMVKGSISHLESLGKSPDPSNINRQLQKDASQILVTWMSSK
jgi:hypothetical protein